MEQSAEQTVLTESILKHSEKILSMEHVFFTNLLLLGFDPLHEQKKHNISFSAEMFRSPNMKGMEVVFYFMFVRLNSKNKEELKPYWPVHDKKQAREFKKVICNKLAQLEKDGDLPLGSVRPSVIETASGKRFYNLLWHFSTYVLRTILESNLNGRSIHLFSENLAENKLSKFTQHQEMIKVIKAQISRECQLFIQHTKRAVEKRKKWQEFDQNIRKQFQEVNMQLEELKRSQREFEESTDINELSQDSLNERIEQVRNMWRVLSEHYRENEKRRDMITGILQQRVNPYRLDINQLLVNPPKLDHQELQHQLDEIDLYVNEKLNLSSLVKMWQVCFNELQTHLTSTDRPLFSNFMEISASVEDYLKTHQSHLSSIKSLNAELINQVQHLQESINKLQVTTSSQIQTPRKQKSQLQTTKREPKSDEKYELIPPTPATYKTLPLTSPLSTAAVTQTLRKNDSRAFSPDLENDTERLRMSVRRVASKTELKLPDEIVLESEKKTNQLDREKTPNVSRIPKPKKKLQYEELNSKSLPSSEQPILANTQPYNKFVNSSATNLTETNTNFTPLRNSNINSSSNHKRSTKSKEVKRNEMNILADQLVDEMLDNTNNKKPLSRSISNEIAKNFSETIDSTAFIPKKQIPRTPLRSPPSINSSSTPNFNQRMSQSVDLRSSPGLFSQPQGVSREISTPTFLQTKNDQKISPGTRNNSLNDSIPNGSPDFEFKPDFSPSQLTLDKSISSPQIYKDQLAEDEEFLALISQTNNISLEEESDLLGLQQNSVLENLDADEGNDNLQ